MKRKDAARKEGTCPRDASKDEKCASCRSKKGACLVAARIAAGKALPSPDEPSTSKPRPTQPVADSDMDIDPPSTRPSRQCQPPERFEVDANITSRATGQRWAAHSCCQNHMDAEPSTSEPAPKPKFTGPMDKYLSDKRVEAAVNRAAKSITDNPADLERELRAFAQTGEDWRQKSMTLEQEQEAIQKKLDKVAKELEKVKRAAMPAPHTAQCTRLRRPTTRSPYVQGCCAPSERFGIRPVCLRCRPRRLSSRGTASHTSCSCTLLSRKAKCEKKERALYRRCWL